MRPPLLFRLRMALLGPRGSSGSIFGLLFGALCVAGVLTETQLHALSALRGRLMGEGDGDRGRIEKLTWKSELVDEREVRVYLPLRSAETQNLRLAACRRRRSGLSSAVGV